MNLSEDEINAIIQYCEKTILEYVQTIESAQKVIEIQNQNNKHLQTIIQKQETLIENLKHQIQINNLIYK
jgi:predicted RNase H-like nuclease (RuvC/YqgF family)